MTKFFSAPFFIWLAFCVFSLNTFSNDLSAQTTAKVLNASTEPAPKKADQNGLKEKCIQSLERFRSYFPKSKLETICEQAHVDDGCTSVNGEPLFHIDTKGTAKTTKKILVFSLIHGDEGDAGALGRFWLERLSMIEPRNDWRVIPVLNPDGVVKKTRTNARGVDLNRNFPTTDWGTHAMANWKQGGELPRRFPGESAASEPEVNCAMKHIKEFNPNFVVSIHTPLNVLDFDGPKDATIKNFSYLPWRRLGNFPGSLGRFLWVENNIPVLTAELKKSLPKNSDPFTQLQDVIGHLTQKDLE